MLGVRLYNFNGMLASMGLSVAMLLGSSIALPASAQNAGDVMNKMGSDERVGYVAGVIEGLAYSRWLKDRPDDTGMKCIYDWYYKGAGKNWTSISAWFNRHPDKYAGPLLHVLIKKECGE